MELNKFDKINLNGNIQFSQEIVYNKLGKVAGDAAWCQLTKWIKLTMGRIAMLGVKTRDTKAKTGCYGWRMVSEPKQECRPSTHLGAVSGYS